MKVSIITVVRNAKELFLQTLASVRAQTYSDIEYIVIDGNSTDGTKEAIIENEQYISAWLSEQDKNLYDAMNKGLQLATGDFVWFLHAGDTIPAPTTLDEIMKNYKGEDFIYGHVKIKQADGTYSNYHKQIPIKLSWKSFLEGMVICHQAMLVRRDIAPLYDLHFSLAGDIDWCIRLLQQTNKTRYVNLVVAEFLAGGISSQRKKASLIERFKIFQKHIGFWGACYQHIVILLKKLQHSRLFISQKTKLTD